jgi:hypothetical protein
MGNRIYYASHSVAIGGTTLTGVQSVGVSTTYNREPVFQLGQLAVYLDQESIADVEVTISKLMDGTMPMYLLACGGSSASGQSITALSEKQCDVTLSTYDDVTGSHINTASMPDMYISNISYNFSVEGNATEDITLVGNVKKSNVSSGASSGSSIPNTGVAALGTKVIAARQHITGIGGQNVTFSVDLSREPLYAFGQLLPTVRLAQFPIEVTTEIEYLATNALDGTASTDSSGCKNYSAGGSYSGTLAATVCHFASSGSSGSTQTVVSAGNSNVITSVNYSGGDAGGGNATVTYSYRNYNTFTVTYS